jgi:hypothetical protein
MPLKKIIFKPGVNRENTRYTTEGGFYESEKVRFRQGTPEVIGGWERISVNTFLGVCRSLWNWVTLNGQNLMGLGTNLKFYIESGGQYFDQTPIREAHTLGSNPFTTYNGFPVVAVYDAAPGNFLAGDFVSFNGASAVGGLTISGNYQIQAAEATFTGSISGTVLTVTSLQSGIIVNGATIDGPGVTAATTITSLGTGAGGVGTYNINNSQTVASTTLTATAPTLTITYFITAASNATSSAAGGGSTVTAAYEINTGSAIVSPLSGWGAGGWGLGGWGTGQESEAPIRLWSQANFGEDLIYGPRGGGVYYWDNTIGLEPYQVSSISVATPTVITTTIDIPDLTAIRFSSSGVLPTGLSANTVYFVRKINTTTFNISATPTGSLVAVTGAGSGSQFISNRGLPLSSLAGDGYAPVVQNCIAVSDASRFVLTFGCNDYTSTVQDPMLIRWSDQEDATTWFPAATNQAGSLRLSHGSAIIAVQQNRQEILVWTDSSIYSLQYLGPPFVWGSQLMGDNISIVGPNAVALANGVSYWMGVDKFYRYDGVVTTMKCDLRRHVFSDINQDQYFQVCAGTNEGFNEIWWFYCSAGSTVIDKYVIYNYLENIWYYGSMGRTAWLDTGLRDYPYAATYANNLVEHENGINDNVTGTALPIEAYIVSSEFDIDDGHNFAFIWRILPDLTFRGSNAVSPTATLYLYPLQNSGSGYYNPTSVGGQSFANVARTATVPIEQFTGQVYTRVRGRQLAFKIYSNQLDTTWQLGAPRFDIRPDGRR